MFLEVLGYLFVFFLGCFLQKICFFFLFSGLPGLFLLEVFEGFLWYLSSVA